MSEEKTKKLRHVTEKPREKPKMRLKFASLVLTAGLFVLPGCGRNEPQKPVEKAPAAEVSEKADEKEESAERKQEREMVNRRISKLKHVLGLLGGNESDVGLDEEEMETVLIVVENTRKVAGLYSESGPVEVNHPLVVLSVDTAIVDAVYEDASRDTKHAVAELLGLSLHSEGQLTYDEYLLFHSLSFESEEEHFSDLFGVVADIKAGKYDNVKVMSPLLSTPDSVATIMPSIEVEGKTDEVAKPAYELTNALIRALEEADISKEELAEFKTDDFRNEVAVEVFKNEANKKKFGEVVFRMFYEKASSKETKKYINDIYAIILEKTGLLTKKEADMYVAMVDGNPPENFNGLKKAMKKSKKVAKSGIVLDKPKKAPEAVEEAKPKEEEVSEIPPNPYESDEAEADEKPKEEKKDCETPEEAFKRLKKKCGNDTDCFVKEMGKTKFCK